MTLGLFIYLLTLTIDLITDYRLWAKQKRVNHIRGALLRLIGLIPAFWLMGWHSLGLIFVYGVLFSGVYGLLIVRNWFYVGTTSAIDKIKRKYPWLFIIEYGLAVAGLAFFIAKSL